MNTKTDKLAGERTQKSKGELLEAIAILAQAGVITRGEEERLQDNVESSIDKVRAIRDEWDKRA